MCVCVVIVVCDWSAACVCVRCCRCWCRCWDCCRLCLWSLVLFVVVAVFVVCAKMLFFVLLCCRCLSLLSSSRLFVFAVF